jgi:hypothetical protein
MLSSSWTLENGSIASGPTVTSQTERYCIFCGNPANSREHLLPEWLQKILPSDEPSVYWREVGGKKTSWEKKGFSEKTKIVCKTCNHGWMSQLETAAKDVLSPAITRSSLPYPVDLRAQWIAAQWAVKTGYVFQGQAPSLLVPLTHPYLLRMNGKPPPQVSVFLGSHHRALKDPGNSLYLQKPLALVPEDEELEPARDFGYLAFLAVGGISFLIIEHRFSNYVEVTLGEHTSKMFLKIWPWVSKVALWPPEILMDYELIEPFFLSNSLPPPWHIIPFPGSRHHQPPFSEVT